MSPLERRVSALEGGPRRGPCLACELQPLNRHASGLPHLVLVCNHRPTALARELAALTESPKGMRHAEQP